MALLIAAFHDCVGNKCDGCINLDNPSNAGLDGVIKFLDGLYVGTYIEDVSRADFWQIANMAAIEHSMNLNNNKCANDDTRYLFSIPFFTDVIANNSFSGPAAKSMTIPLHSNGEGKIARHLR